MSRRVLIADDEPNIARLAQISLMRHGFEVTAVTDGVQALASIADERPDIVILDVMMPHKDGFEVLRALKDDAATREIPVVMMTAQAKDADILRGTRMGAAQYLTKPVNPAELLRVVQEVLADREA